MIKRKLRVKTALLLGAVFLFLAGGVLVFTQQVDKTWQWKLPEGFPEPWVPADNPMTEAKFQLGRHLFYDKRLSGNGTQACASCHFQHLAFTDGLANSVGSTGHSTDRSAQSLVNVAYYSTLTWANPALGRLEHQDEVPLFADVIVEMGVSDENMHLILQRFEKDPFYQKAFVDAYPEVKNPFNFGSITYALATFQRGIISADSRYDQAEKGKTTLSALEARGKSLFFGQAQCSQCHSGFNFSDHTFHQLSPNRPKPFHNTGLYNLDGKGAYPDNNLGLASVMSGSENVGKFRAPSLRNVALTAPYMHDGSIATLEEVIDHYARQGRLIAQGPFKGDGRLSPLKDSVLDNIKIEADDKPALMAFLKTLTDETVLKNPRFSDPFEQMKRKN